MASKASKDMFEQNVSLSRKEAVRIEALRLAVQTAPLLFPGTAITGRILFSEAEVIADWIEGKALT